MFYLNVKPVSVLKLFQIFFIIFLDLFFSEQINAHELHEMEVMKKDGSYQKMQLTSFTAEKASFQTEKENISLTTEDFLTWGTPSAPASSRAIFLLNNGAQLVSDIHTLKEKNFQIAHEFLGDINIPVSSVTGILFAQGVTPGETDQRIDTLLQEKHSKDAVGDKEKLYVPGDQVFLLNGDVLTGVVDTLNDQLLTLIPDPTDPGGVFLKKPENISIEVTSVHSIRFSPILRSAPSPVIPILMVGLRDGSIFPLSTEELETSFQKAGWKVPVKDITYLESCQSVKKCSLTDYPPEKNVFTPWGNIIWPYQINRGVLGGGLYVSGKRYLRGYGVHSASRLVWTLPDSEKDRIFQVKAALDDSASHPGNVVFSILLDSIEKGKVSMNAGEAPHTFTVPVGKTRSLELRVDYGAHGDVQDRAVWLEPVILSLPHER